MGDYDKFLETVGATNSLICNSTMTTAVIVMGGSFSPIHSGHIACLQAARRHLIEERGFERVVAYCAVAHEGYVQRKYAKKGTHMLLHHRLALVNEIAAQDASDQSFLQISQKAFGSAVQMIGALQTSEFIGKPDSEFFVVVGADRATQRRGRFEKIAVSREIDSAAAASAPRSGFGFTLLAAPAETIALSATAIRQRLCVGCSAAGHSDECVDRRASALQSLRDTSSLPAEVCNYLEANPDAVPLVFSDVCESAGDAQSTTHLNEDHNDNER